VLDPRLIALGGLGGSPLQVAVLGLLPSAEQPPQIIGPMLGRRPARRTRDDDEAVLLALGLL
jgi:hypothetical protein